MSVCLHHIEVIARDRFFFTNFAFVCSSKGKPHPVIDFPVHGEHDGENSSSAAQFVSKLQVFL